MNEKLDKQEKNKEESKPARYARGRLLPGNTANLKGRPVGKGLKEYQKQKFYNMTDKEKEKFLQGISKELRWRMSEGNPPTDVNLGGNPDLPFTIKIIQQKDEGKDSGVISEAV